MSVDTQTLDNQPSLPVPTVEQFKHVVSQQLQYWTVTTINGLCPSQTESLIEDLASYYHVEGETTVPDEDTFKQVVGDFQENSERVRFADLNDSEVKQLLTLLAPHFHASAEEANKVADSTAATEDDEGTLDNHPF